MTKYPSWKYRYFRLRYVDYAGIDGFEIGIRFSSREQFHHDDPVFRALGITLGRREFVFDLGKVK